jgi:hypothetical protein
MNIGMAFSIASPAAAPLSPEYGRQGLKLFISG